MLDSRLILSADEVARVVAWLRDRRRRGPNFVLHRAIFRLSCCCGLRTTEICRLNLGDVLLAGSHPVLVVAGKGQRPQRTVPISERGTLMDLAYHYSVRVHQLGRETREAPFLCGVSQNAGKRLTRDLVSKRWRTLMRVVPGAERASQLPIRSGRRTFAALAGRPVNEISRALGTSSATAQKYMSGPANLRLVLELPGR